VYCLSGIVMGLFPSNRLFVALLGIQGAGDNSLAVGASLLADFVMAAPQGYSGSKEDGYFSQLIYGAVRLGAHNSKGDDYVEKELSVQNTVVLILQTVGIVGTVSISTQGLCVLPLSHRERSSCLWCPSCCGTCLRPSYTICESPSPGAPCEWLLTLRSTRSTCSPGTGGYGG
jgi:hypothetical protein